MTAYDTIAKIASVTGKTQGETDGLSDTKWIFLTIDF